MAFDGVVIANLVHDMNNLIVNGRINKIYQPEEDELLIVIKNEGQTHRLYISASASLPLIHMVTKNKDNPMTAPNFCMLLRKHVGSGRIVSVTQPNFERIIDIAIEHLDEMGDRCIKHLMVEIMGKHSNIIFTDNEVVEAKNKIYSIFNKISGVLSLETREILQINIDNDIAKIIEGNYEQTIYKYFSLLSNRPCSIFDYCTDYTKVMVSSTQLEKSMALLLEESWHYLNDLFEDGKCISHLSMYQDITKIVHKNDNNTIFTNEFLTNEKEIVFNVKTVPLQTTKRSDLIEIIRSYLNSGYKIIASLNSKENIYLLEDVLTKNAITYESVEGLNIPTKCKIGISLLSLGVGFVLEDEKVVVLTSKELFNINIKSTRYNNKFKEATILKSYEDLEYGDYVVHEFNGIGQYLGLENLEVDGVHRDFIKILYAGGDYILVPLSQFHLVRKYLGKEGFVPRLSKLNGKDWEKTKQRVKEKIDALANRLMQLYIERSKVKGFAFEEDSEFQKEFEDGFPYISLKYGIISAKTSSFTFVVAPLSK